MSVLYIKNAEGTLSPIETIKGDKGDPLNFDDLTEDQKRDLAGYCGGISGPEDSEIVSIVNEAWV